MKKSGSILKNSASRRRFLQNGMIAAGAATIGTELLPGSLSAFAQAVDDSGGLSKGDASILRFLLAAEILESDLWEQYWELSSGRVTHRGDFASKINPSTGAAPVGTGGNPAYLDALQLLDQDMPQYIVDNTDDEFSHTNFLLAYLKSKGANTADLDLLVGPISAQYQVV